MPAYVNPPFPDALETVAQILGINRARMALLLALRDQPKTVPQLADELGVQRVTLNRHLRELEAHDIVRGSRPPGPERRGGVIYWRLNPIRIVAELNAFARWFH